MGCVDSARRDWQKARLSPFAEFPPMRLCLTALPLLALAVTAHAQTVPTAPISEATLKEVTKELSSDAYEGRAPGTAGEDKTVAYLAKRFAR